MFYVYKSNSEYLNTSIAKTKTKVTLHEYMFFSSKSITLHFVGEHQLSVLIYVIVCFGYMYHRMLTSKKKKNLKKFDLTYWKKIVRYDKKNVPIGKVNIYIFE